MFVSAFNNNNSRRVQKATASYGPTFCARVKVRGERLQWTVKENDGGHKNYIGTEWRRVQMQVHTMYIEMITTAYYIGIGKLNMLSARLEK